MKALSLVPEKQNQVLQEEKNQLDSPDHPGWAVL